jgi:hypothetical protein
VSFSFDGVTEPVNVLVSFFLSWNDMIANVGDCFQTYNMISV